MDGIQPFPFETDIGLAGRARIGVVVLASDHTLEHEFRHLLNLPGVAFYVSRIPMSPEVTMESLTAMKGDIASRAEVILPGVDLSVVAYGCTSATMVMGEDVIFEQIRKGRPGAKPTTPITAAFAAFDAFDAKRIAVLTPYIGAVNERVRRFIEGRGYTIPVFGSFNEGNDNVAARISVDSMRQAILTLGRRDDVDMVFLSCTSLRLAEDVRSIEAELGKPVTSSNHAMAWHCLRLAGIDDKLPQHGMLFER